MQKEYFFRIFLKGDTSGKSLETCDTQDQVKQFIEDNLTLDLDVEEWEMNSDGSGLQLRQK